MLGTKKEKSKMAESKGKTPKKAAYPQPDRQQGGGRGAGDWKTAEHFREESVSLRDL